MSGERGKSKKRKRKTTESELTIESMETYVKFKSFDVIGNGTYRRYVNSCKEKGEPWAIKMTQGLSYTILHCLTLSFDFIACAKPRFDCATVVWAAMTDFAAKIKVIQGLVNDLQNSEKNGLYSLCQTVMENNTPPIEQNTVIAECCVSGKEKCQCIILKCKGRGAPCITVQSRFSHFVLMFWTVFKIDLIIKTVTREVIDGMPPQSNSSMRSMCDLLLQDSTKINRLSLSLLHAIEHVENSLRTELVT